MNRDTLGLIPALSSNLEGQLDQVLSDVLVFRDSDPERSKRICGGGDGKLA